MEIKTGRDGTEHLWVRSPMCVWSFRTFADTIVILSWSLLLPCIAPLVIVGLRRLWEQRTSRSNSGEIMRRVRRQISQVRGHDSGS